MNLYLIEFYTVDGDINFAWVKACNREAALKALGLNVTFSECIQITEQNEISKRLKTLDNKLSSEQAYLQKLQNIKSGLMADLLSGNKLVSIPKEMETQTT